MSKHPSRTKTLNGYRVVVTLVRLRGFGSNRSRDYLWSVTSPDGTWKREGACNRTAGTYATVFAIAQEAINEHKETNGINLL
jgi:hypothetical protein